MTAVQAKAHLEKMLALLEDMDGAESDDAAALRVAIEAVTARVESHDEAKAEPSPLWRHAITECNEAHAALDRLGAPKTRTVRSVRGEGDQEITLGLRDRILSLRT